MRLIEIGITIYTIILLVFRKHEKFQSNKLPTGIGFILLWIFQIIEEGFRWQSWGLVLAAGLAVAFLYVDKKWLAGLAGLAIVVSVVLMFLFPIPAPGITSGPFAVGTATYHLIDESREEHYAEEAGLDREFVVQVWYPAEAGTGEIAPWMPDIDQAGPALAAWLELPGFILNHLEYVSSNASTGATPVQNAGGFPILFFSHGWTGFKEQNSVLMEELASQGYIVASINHTYGSILTVFPDGKAIPRNPDALPSGVSLEAYDIASNLLVKQWAGDIAYTLDVFETGDFVIGADTPLSAMINFSSIATMGHSTGGGAALEFCYAYAQCAAIFAMDPWVEPMSETVRVNGITAPALFLFSENWDSISRPERNYSYVNQMIANSSSEIHVATVLGAKHMDFSMLPLLSPVTEQIGLKGPIDGDLMIEIMNVYAVKYFEHIFYGGDEGAANMEPYPEVLFGTMPDEIK